MALGQDRLADIGRDLLFGTARPQPARNLRVHPVDGLPSRAQRRDLRGRLARAQRAQRGAGQFLPRARQRGSEPQHHQCPHTVREPDRAGAPEARRHQRVRVVGLFPWD
jgi:hypothetical protein